MTKCKKISRLLSLLIIITMVAGFISPPSYGGEGIANSLKVDLDQEALNKIMPNVKEDLDKEDMAEVLVYMEEQVDTSMVALATERAMSRSSTPYKTKLAVRRSVVEALKDKQESSQLNLLKYLRQEKEKGNVEEFKSYSIVNMVYIKARREVIENIAYMPEIARIYKNMVHQLEDDGVIKDEINLNSNEIEWNIDRVNANQAWELGFDGRGIVVGIIDTGVDWTHPALKEKWRGYDPNTGNTDSNGNWFDPIGASQLPEDELGHGTHVAGTVLGQEADGSNKIGVAPGAKWIAAKTFDSFGTSTDDMVLASAEWMLAPSGDPSKAPDIVNNSWGGADGINDWFRDIVINWRSAGILPVFSAGNQREGEPAPWPGSISVPANYPESFAVAAVDINNKRGSFSKLGPSPYDKSLIKPDISAPGVAIRSSVPGGTYGVKNGTSMAAPHVSGIIALLLSGSSDLSLDDIEYILTSTAIGLTDADYTEAPNFGYGYGLVDALEVVSQVSSGTGILEGRVMQDKEDMEDAVIIHEQEIYELYLGTEMDVLAQITDDVAVKEVELLVKQEGKPYWLLVPMGRISGNHKDGVYKGTIKADMLLGDHILYKIRVRDYAGEMSITKDHRIEVLFGILPDKYEQGFERETMGWQFNGIWEWGEPTGNSPKPYEGKNVAGTVLGGNYPDRADSWLITPPIDLRDESLESATFRFHEWYDTDNIWDEGHTLVSNDYGKTWVNVRDTITGNGREWSEHVINLKDYIGSPEPIFIAFRFTSDLVVNGPGWFIDNVRLIGVDKEAPAIPTGVKAVTDLAGIKVSWDPVADKDLSHYNVYRSIDLDEEFELIVSTNNKSILDIKAKLGFINYYKIKAVDYANNESEFSEMVSATPIGAKVIFGSDFEDDKGGFRSGIVAGTENPWEHGIPRSGPNAAYSGEKLWATNLAGNYKDNTAAYIESPTVSLPDDKNAMLTFNHWVDIEGSFKYELYDYGQVHISNDDGRTWTNVTPVKGGRYGTQIREWSSEEISLAQYRGEDIKIRFHFYSDDSGSYSGWYIDDVYVTEVGINPPDMPEEFTASAGLAGIKLAWKHSSNEDLFQYNIYRATELDGNYALIKSFSNNSYIDSNVEFGRTYYYKVQAVNYTGLVSDFSQVVSATPLETVVIFRTDFENDNGDFVSGIRSGNKNPWEWGVPTSGPHTAYSGDKLWATNLSGDYPSDTSAYIESKSVSLTKDRNLVLLFNHWVDIEGSIGHLWDYGEIHISDNGGRTWTNITPGDSGQYGTRVEEWKNEQISLNAYKGKNIKLRFYFYSDYSGEYPGWYIDDVSIIATDLDIRGQEIDGGQDFRYSKLGDQSSKDKNFLVPNFSILDDTTYEYIKVEDVEVENMPLARGRGIPVDDAVVTILETGRSVKVDPVTGAFKMRVPIGEYTIRAEGYGLISQDIEIVLNDSETRNHVFVLEPKPQGSIRGRVFDRYYLTPAAHAVIRLVEDGRIKPVVADENGEFLMANIYEGDYTLRATAEGFESSEFSIEVIGEETLDIDIPLKGFVGYEDEISYDDGTAENALVLNGDKYGLAVRFTPKGYGKVEGTNIFFWGTNWPSPGGTEISIVIYDIDEYDNPIMIGKPKVVNVIRGAWNYIDLSEFGFSTDRDFYISTMQTKDAANSPGLGVDQASKHSDRSYLNINGDFKSFPEEKIVGSLMIRARVSNIIGVPQISNLVDINYTNKDSIRVEGAITGEGQVNIYVNDEKAASVDTQNGRFSLDVELPLDENEIMATAELNGRETEPSKKISIIKDKENPVVTVSEPLDNTRTNKELIHVKGNARDNIELERLLVNDIEVDLDEDGDFHERVILEQGENKIIIKAIDIVGNETVIERTIYANIGLIDIHNIEPADYKELRAGDILTVSFQAPADGEGYFRILMPFETFSSNLGIPMEEENGLYSGTWLVPERFVASDLQVQIVYLDGYGNKTIKIAPGKITVIGNIMDLKANTIIIGQEAFDAKYLDANQDLQVKLREAYKLGLPIYISLNDSLFVDAEGNVIDFYELPQSIVYYGEDKSPLYYER